MRMIGFIQYNGIALINIIKNGIPTLIYKSGDLLPFEFMTVEEKRVCQSNAKARHIIMCALSEEEMSKVHAMVSTKEMWDTLALTYEGSKEVIQNDAGSTKGKVLALKSSQKNVKKKVQPKASEDIDNTSDDTKSDDEISIYQ